MIFFLRIWLLWAASLGGSLHAASDPCAALCLDVAAPAAKARCHSCRCKAAFDGWLPSRQELQCAKGTEIVVYRSRSGSPTQLEPVYDRISECHNPALFGGSCAPGSRLGQLAHGDVHFKWICRRNVYTPAFTDPTVPYDEVAVIGTNARTGETCFWDDSSGGITAEGFPSIDVAQGSEAEAAAFSMKFPVTEGYGCIYCHDNDPFLYSPYLKSVGWRTGPYTSAPFARVLLQGKPAATGLRMLTAPGAAACTSCHRITDGRTCLGWAADAFGEAKDYGYESTVLGALDRFVYQNGTKVRVAGTDWSLAYWMPPRFDPAEPAWSAWHLRSGKAKETILKCCGEIHSGKTSPECTWAPVPDSAVFTFTRKKT